MPLIDINTGKEIKKVPAAYAKDYRRVMGQLTGAEICAMKDELNRMIDGDEVHTAGWMPGADWSGTPFWPLYEKGTGGNRALSGMMFGLLVWEVFTERPERWGSGRFEKDGKDIGSRTYFKIK